jgi:hypothetical protein
MRVDFYALYEYDSVVAAKVMEEIYVVMVGFVRRHDFGQRIDDDPAG